MSNFYSVEWLLIYLEAWYLSSRLLFSYWARRERFAVQKDFTIYCIANCYCKWYLLGFQPWAWFADCGCAGLWCSRV